MVLLALSGEVPNREQNQEDQSSDSACDRADHSGYPSVPDGIAPQASIVHGRSSWSLSPSECGWNKVEVCLGERDRQRGVVGDGGWAPGEGKLEPWPPRARLMTRWLLLAPGCSGFRSVDHRLRLFLDVEVFSDSEEEFQCCIKVCATH